mgnify:CR=1 FL=1
MRDGSKSVNLFRTRVHALIADNFWDGHTSHFIEIAHLEVFRILLIRIVVAFCSTSAPRPSQFCDPPARS